MEVGNITKAATFNYYKSCYTKVTKTRNNFFFVRVFFNNFMRQTLTDEFWGLHKNMNCSFPLRKIYGSRIVLCFASKTKLINIKHIKHILN